MKAVMKHTKKIFMNFSLGIETTYVKAVTSSVQKGSNP